MRKTYERDEETFNADAYTVKGERGIAWRVLGWETEPDRRADGNTAWEG